MMQGGKTFSGDNSAFILECRGITFHPDGKIATRPMQKFFNVGETAELAPEKIIWEDVSRVMIKQDGSMVTPIWVNGKLTFKTQKAFMNREAKVAFDICKNTQYTGSHSA